MELDGQAGQRGYDGGGEGEAAKDAEERAQFEEGRSKAGAAATFGTFGDLLKKRS